MAAPVDCIQDPYLEILDLTTSENLKLYKKAIFGLPESDKYDLTRSKWTDFYQELEDSISTFGLKAEVLIVITIDINQTPTEFNNIILFY